MQQPLRKKYFSMDDSFKAEDTAGYDLLVELGSGISSFGIIDRDKNLVTGIGSFENPVFSVLDEFRWLRNPFHSTKISLLNNRYTLIPEQLFIPEEKETYTSFLLDSRKENEEIRSDRIEHAGIYSVYAIPEHFPDKLHSVLPDAKLYHISGVLIRSLLVNFSHSLSSVQIFLNVRDEAFDLLIFSEKQLQYCNSFNIRTPEDLVYYLIFVMEQLDLDPEVVPMFLLGEVSPDTPLFEIIFRYIRNVSFIPATKNVQLSGVLDDLPSHQFYSLINMSLCGS
ncbi:MAG TPA: DUF3822 family protein [Bacteroidales bacterium]|nr:DUF3822 family protein [Bacteroidales bacterium]